MPRPPRSRPLSDGEPCHCGRATAPDLQERLPDGRVLHHGRLECRARAPVSVLIYLSADQFAALSAAADRAGLGLSSWLRSLGMREAER